MNDQRLWNFAIERLNGLIPDISTGTGLPLLQLLDRYQQSKKTLAAVVADVDAASVCRACGGECCLNGKYRINVFDALALIAQQTPTLVDFAQKPLCPYGTGAGCSMEPGLRPADCVLFICSAIDLKLSPEARSLLVAEEKILRECILDASRLTSVALGTPLLLWAEKNINPNHQV